VSGAGGRTLALALLSGLVAACATTPITVEPTSVPMFPPASGAPATVKPAAFAGSRQLVDAGPSCAVRLADVRDVRPDPNDLGMMIGRAVKASDSQAWFRSAVDGLKQDQRLHFVDADADAQVILRAELVKAYILVQNTEKSANVVIRAVYMRDGKDIDSQIVRGSDVGANWVNGEGEAQGSLNRALAAAVSELDQNLGAHCNAAVKASN
jgi:hypothetical protein